LTIVIPIQMQCVIDVPATNQVLEHQTAARVSYPFTERSSSPALPDYSHVARFRL